MRRTRYQQGSLTLAERKRERKTWEYRWYETASDGKRKRRCLVVGTLQDFPSETLAQRALDALKKDINVEHPRSSRQNLTVGSLIEHYREKEMGEHSTKTHATCVTYEGYIRKWIMPRWSDYVVTNVKAVVVEEWLRSLPLANGSKAKIRNIMHALFRHAIRWDWIEQNPITSVRQSAKRQEIPAIFRWRRLRPFWRDWRGQPTLRHSSLSSRDCGWANYSRSSGPTSISSANSSTSSGPSP